MKFPTALVAFVALSASALAKDDKKKPGEGECAKEQEYDMGCSDKVAPHLGSNTIAVCRSKQWQVLHVCSEKETCTEKPDPHCWKPSLFGPDSRGAEASFGWTDDGWLKKVAAPTAVEKKVERTTLMRVVAATTPAAKADMEEK